MASKKEAWNQEENQWYQAAREAARALEQRPAFRYDPARDPAYLQARDQVLRQGRRAMEDSMGKAAGLTGGYSSSYAQALGQQAMDRQLDRLEQLLPEYYDRARAVYDKEGDGLKDSLSRALGLYDKDYGAYLDRQKQDRWEQEFAEDHQRWTAQQANSAASAAASAAKTERSYAYRMAMLALQQGLSVSDALLKTAGIDKSYAETIRRYYAAQH